jgi:hypothetical protein
MAYFTDVGMATYIFSWSKTIQRRWFNSGFVRIMIKGHIRENPFVIGTSILLEMVAFVLRSIIRADDQVTRECSAIVRRFPCSLEVHWAGNWGIA